MSLTVLSVAFPLAEVGPHGVGGSEQILSQLDRGLVAAGHTSLVVACEGSQVAGTLLPVRAEAGSLEGTRERASSRFRARVDGALARYPVDVVHLHGLDFDKTMPDHGPTLVTLHLPLAWYPPEAWTRQRPDLWYNCVSPSQQNLSEVPVRFCPPIANGIDVDAYAARHARRPFAINLSRICVEKGVHLALDAAKRADMSLLIGGQVFRYDAHERYFRDEIEPRLDARRRFLGPLGLERKRRLLSSAQCLAVASTAPETSSLVAMEALACGTPVVALASGALPDIIEHGVTGFLVNDVDDLADAMRRAHTIDPEACRHAARTRFSGARMIADYFRLYDELAHLKVSLEAGAA